MLEVRRPRSGCLRPRHFSVPEVVPGAMALVLQLVEVSFPMRQRERAARMTGMRLSPSTGRSVTQGSPFRFPSTRWVGSSGPRWCLAMHFLLMTVSRYPVTLALMPGWEALAGAPSGGAVRAGCRRRR